MNVHFNREGCETKGEMKGTKNNTAEGLGQLTADLDSAHLYEIFWLSHERSWMSVSHKVANTQEKEWNCAVNKWGRYVYHTKWDDPALQTILKCGCSIVKLLEGRCFYYTDPLISVMHGLCCRVSSCMWLSAAHVSFVSPSSCGLTSALYGGRGLIIWEEQKTEGRGTSGARTLKHCWRQWCSTSPPFPKKQLLCYCSHFDHRYGINHFPFPI